MAKIHTRIILTIILLLQTGYVHAEILQEALDLFEAASGSVTSYSNLFRTITIAMVSVFAIWVQVATFRSYMDAQLTFLATFMMVIRVVILTAIVGSLFTFI